MNRLKSLGSTILGIAVLIAAVAANAEAPAGIQQLAEQQVPPGEVPQSRPHTDAVGPLLPSELRQAPTPRRAAVVPPITDGGASAALERHGASGRLGPTKTAQVLLPGARRPVKLTYEIVAGMAVFEGDIVLGPAVKVEQFSLQHRSCRGQDCPWRSSRGRLRAESYRWPGGVIPYTIDPGLHPQVRGRLETALRRVAGRTRMILRPRRGERDFVTFRPAPRGCTASVGRRRGQQFVNLEKRCRTGNVIHESLHAAGLYHEQSRNDRDGFVRIIWPNVIPARAFNLRKLPGRGVDYGPYDYGSIMHYGATGFGKRGPDGRRKMTIQVLRAGASIGQRRAMSRLDIASVNNLVAQERCIDLAGASPRVVRLQGRVVLAGRRHWFANFGRQEKLARRAASIMRAHRIDRVCLIGRGSKIRAQLLLQRGHPPARQVRGEVCNPINPNLARVRSVRGRWWVTQSSGRRMFGIAAFDSSTDALRAQDVIQHFRMRYVCRVGPRSKAFTYFRR